MNMDFIRNFPLFCIILTLFSGVACTVLKPKAARNLCFTIVTLDGILNSFVLLYVLRKGTYFIYMMGHFPAPWGNEIRVGVLEAVLAVMFSVVMLLSLMGGLKHIFHDVEETKGNLYFLMMNLLFVSMLALIYTNDLFTAYVFVEINTIASCAIVMLKKSDDTLVATFRYLTMSTLGSGMFLLGICILYDITGHLLMTPIKESVAASGQYALALEVVIVLFCVGLGTKSAAFPFASWLPEAHGSATTASSSVLSGLVLKSYLILMIKIIYRVIGLDVFRFSKAINVLFVMGALGMISGSIHALMQKNLKKMLAYSSVAQIGYVYLAIGLGSDAGMAAAFIQIIVHAITKPMLFSAAGGFMSVSGESKSFAKLKGAGRRNLLAGIAFIVGSLSMIGIPLFAGFISKIYLAGAAADGSVITTKKMLVALAVLAISTLLNAMYYIPVIMVLFSKTKDSEKLTLIPDRSDKAFVLAMAIFIILNFAMGCASTPLIDMIKLGVSQLA